MNSGHVNNGHFNNGMYYNQSQTHIQQMHQRQAMYSYNQQQRPSQPVAMNFGMPSQYPQQQVMQTRRHTSPPSKIIAQQQPIQARRHTMQPLTPNPQQQAATQYQNGQIRNHSQVMSASPSPNINSQQHTQQQQPFNIANSIEHQQCIQFLKSRNFSHNATPQQRKEILTKINILAFLPRKIT